MPEKSGGNSFKWLVIAVVIAAVAGGYFYFRSQRPAAAGFNSAAVARGELTQTVTATGILNPVKSVQIGCQVSGRISKLFVDFNSVVTNGQLIAEIDPRIYDAQVEQAEADLANASANLELQPDVRWLGRQYDLREAERLAIYAGAQHVGIERGRQPSGSFQVG